jgi:hypothetical protein
MRSSALFRTFLVILLAFGLSARTARALVTLNDGTDKIYVSGSFSMGYDSNISASAANTSDFAYSSSMSIEYQRKAGLIGVNGTIAFALNDFVKNPGYDTLNPSYSIELDKGTGRMTGALTLSAQRTSQADVAVNLYDTSWNYSVGLNLHYPVIERYSFALSLNYGLLDYTDKGGQPLVNLATYSASLSLFYILSEQRDLFATYRYRLEESSATTSTADQGLSLGVNGKIIWEINGSLSVGYELRTPRGFAQAGTDADSEFGDFWVTGTANWAANRKLAFSGSLSRDFSTTATGATTVTTSGTLDATWSQNARLSFNAGVGGGINQFYGPFGLLPNSTRERRDYYFTWHTGVNYTFNSHLSASLTYTYFQNWSNLAFAAFDRNSVTLTLSSHW